VQQRLLELLVQHQRAFGATKLVVGRKDGRLHFDEDTSRRANVSLVAELWGPTSADRGAEFERLVESMPSEYVRLLPEARWDSPFVLTVTPDGMEYLHTHK